RLAARELGQRLNRDPSDHAGSDLPCACGRRARYAGRRAKGFQTVLGLVTLERAYYHCGACGQGFCPRDRALGLTASMLSPGVTRMVGQVAARVSFAEGSDLLAELAGLRVDAKHVERAAEALGREVAEDERGVVVPPPAPSAPTLYLGVDGTGVPMRAAEVEGRPGKQPDGSAKTREAKLCTVWSAESRDPEGQPTRDPGSVTYSGAIESAATRDTDLEPSEFAARVVREATRRGFEQAPRRVVLGDGAVWIWNLAHEQFPGALQIVDRCHAKQKLNAVAKAIYGPISELGTAWAQGRKDELDAGDVEAIVRALAPHTTTHEEARQCRDYIQRNRARLNYPEFEAQGLCTTTAVVEAGCKVTVGTRLKRAGMHWTVGGANAILALRCCVLSGRFDDFWYRRARPSKAA
ncbi:MAG: ISKra4 family transposase, partial [Patescibacteria group bacterium]